MGSPEKLSSQSLIEEGVMNSKGYGWIVVVSAMVATGLSQSAIAEDSSSASASVVIDWSHLQLSVTGVNGVVPSVGYSDTSTKLTSRVLSGSSDTESTTHSTQTISTSAGGNEQAHAFGSTTTFSADAEAEGDRFSRLGGIATGIRQIDYSISGPGTITATVPYTLSLDLSCVPCFSASHAIINTQADFHPDIFYPHSFYFSSGDYNSYIQIAPGDYPYGSEQSVGAVWKSGIWHFR